LMVEETVPPLVPALTLQTMSLFLADSSEPRSTMAILGRSLRTVQVGPLNGGLPNSEPLHQSRPRTTRRAPRPPPRTAGRVLRWLRQAGRRGRREEVGAREVVRGGGSPFAGGEGLTEGRPSGSGGSPFVTSDGLAEACPSGCGGGVWGVS